MLHLRRLALRIQVAPELLERLGRLPLHQLANLLVLVDGVLLAILLFFGRVLLRLILSADDRGDVVSSMHQDRSPASPIVRVVGPAV